MEERYVFSELKIDKTKIMNWLKRSSLKRSSLKRSPLKRGKGEGNTITLLIMGHGREVYRENFKKVIEERGKGSYSPPFVYTVNRQEDVNSVRILSKAGKPKICAWDYSLCTKSMSSQDIIQFLSKEFFNEETNDIDSLTLLKGLSLYFKTIYPDIIEKVARGYRDLPEDKNPGSPDAEGYTERFEDFNKVLQSLEENKFSDLKRLTHEKIFSIRPESKEIYEEHCERYLLEIVDLRIDEGSYLTDIIENNLKVGENLVKNYYTMDKEELDKYINDYGIMVNDIKESDLPDEEKYYLLKFIYNIYFGHEILLSEIVEFLVILGIETINIIDNTCRVKAESRKMVYSKTPETAEIEEEEQLKVSTLGGKRSRRMKKRNNRTRKERK